MSSKKSGLELYYWPASSDLELKRKKKSAGPREYAVISESAAKVYLFSMCLDPERHAAAVE